MSDPKPERPDLYAYSKSDLIEYARSLEAKLDGLREKAIEKAAMAVVEVIDEKDCLCPEHAAAEIDRLRARVAELEQAMREEYGSG